MNEPLDLGSALFFWTVPTPTVAFPTVVKRVGGFAEVRAYPDTEAGDGFADCFSVHA